jgi:phosphate starvation-inducible protein PhoH
VRGIGMVQLGQEDIVRHSLVQRIVEAYGTTDKPRGEAPHAEQGPITVDGD